MLHTYVSLLYGQQGLQTIRAGYFCITEVNAKRSLTSYILNRKYIWIAVAGLFNIYGLRFVIRQYVTIREYCLEFDGWELNL